MATTAHSVAMNSADLHAMLVRRQPTPWPSYGTFDLLEALASAPTFEVRTYSGKTRYSVSPSEMLPIVHQSRETAGRLLTFSEFHLARIDDWRA